MMTVALRKRGMSSAGVVVSIVCIRLPGSGAKVSSINWTFGRIVHLSGDTIDDALF